MTFSRTSNHFLTRVYCLQTPTWCQRYSKSQGINKVDTIQPVGTAVGNDQQLSGHWGEKSEVFCGNPKARQVTMEKQHSTFIGALTVVNVVRFGQGLGLPHRLQRRWTWIDSARRRRCWRCGQMDPAGDGDTCCIRTDKWWYKCGMLQLPCYWNRGNVLLCWELN